MNFTLIVCTFQRAVSLHRLMKSVQEQSLYPHQILIVDGSFDDNTRELTVKENYLNLEYYKVAEKDRGLTRQRNFGISKVDSEAEVVCFLDDDIVLTPEYFEKLTDTYRHNSLALGVGGYIINENSWIKHNLRVPEYHEFEYDGWIRTLGSRNVLRKKLNLLSDQPPGYMPEFSNGFSTGFLPPSGKIYPVEFFMGGVASYRTELFKKIKFSRYFEGYGLYEDMDFCLRASRIGNLYVNTDAKVVHLHDHSGRPNKYRYGKMVIENGWYVWRLKYPNPVMTARIKWHSIAFLLTLVRFLNVLNTKEKKEAFTEGFGRLAGWSNLMFFHKKKA